MKDQFEHYLALIVIYASELGESFNAAVNFRITIVVLLLIEGFGMALYDGKISIRSTLDQVWWAAEMTLTPAQQVVSSTKPAAFAAMDENYGYVFVFRERGNGEVGVRLLIDEAPRVREVFNTYRGSDALNMLATLSNADRELLLEVAQDGEQRLREIKTYAERATMAPQMNSLPPDLSSFSASSPISDQSSFQYSAAQAAPAVTVSRMDQRTIRPGFGIPALIFVIVALILILVGMVLFAIGRTTPNSFSSDAFALTYPEGWQPLDINTLADCKNAVPPCSVVLANVPFNSVTLRFRSITTDVPRSIEDIEANDWNSMKAVEPDLEFVRQERVQLAGKQSVRITYRQQVGDNNLAIFRTLVIVSPTRFLEIVTKANSTARYNDNRDAVEQILNSISIKE
ncbi:MAG: hypothetical protein U0528_10865 [Anaerolineae bacterium]|nr:hypothetical protein [Anaerolineae bacterium]